MLKEAYFRAKLLTFKLFSYSGNTILLNIIAFFFCLSGNVSLGSNSASPHVHCDQN